MLSFVLTVKRFLEALVKAFKNPMFLSLFTTLFLIILSGTLFYTKKEGWGVLDAIYFCVVSLIPTGVNTNLSPVTNLGKIFTMFYLVVGTGVMFITLLTLGKTMISTNALEERKTVGQKKLNDYKKKK
ncbi:two pore domain potassium channel family protein [Psychrobacillus sp. INOP01]|uniref:potassium channel family protein n=1 Tax=Psychrobacillus sp. INOP01 TaxID=2829187 RepID=UPI001BA6579F|nr:potassium channel family protein [Psychrobacillus sp. INOP01]QUG43398.1 two pore domain potassium channel family protein [Psychrobacillus sp. INOP01]